MDGASSSSRGSNPRRKRSRYQGPAAANQGADEGTPRHQYLQPITAPTLAPADEGPAPMDISFEAKIGLALRGSNWQQLQGTAPALAASEIDTPSQNGEGNRANGIEMPKGTSRKQKKKRYFDKQITRDTGEVFQVIEANSLTAVPQNVSWDQDPELLCCYNWQASTDGTNTIFVPGEPAKWQQPTLPHTLERDSGFQYTDYNYARQPRDPYAPMFHALSAMNPNYQFSDIDVLADRNNLRVLLEFVQGKANGPFRLDLYLVFNTLVILRKESRWWKLSDGVGYGCNFEKFFTKPSEGMEDATSHYRAIRYPMGPLNVVCRFEADAYSDGLLAPDELSSFEANAISGGLAERPQFNFKAPIRVLHKGNIVPTAQMVELKTVKHNPGKSCAVSCQDQLWFGRTSLLFIGLYDSNTGEIKRIKFEDARERIRNWEENNQDSLRKLVTLLTQLRAVLERRPNRAVVLVREEKGGPLSIRSMKGVQHAVGKDFFMRYWKPWKSTHMQSDGRGGGHRDQTGGQGAFNTSRGHG